MGCENFALLLLFLIAIFYIIALPCYSYKFIHVFVFVIKNSNVKSRKCKGFVYIMYSNLQSLLFWTWRIRIYHKKKHFMGQSFLNRITQGKPHTFSYIFRWIIGFPHFLKFIEKIPLITYLFDLFPCKFVFLFVGKLLILLVKESNLLGASIMCTICL